MASDLDERTNPVEARVAVLETKFDTIASDVKKIKASLQAIQEKLQTIQENFAWMKGRIETLPTTMQMITLVFGSLGGAFVILRFGLPRT